MREYRLKGKRLITLRQAPLEPFYLYRIEVLRPAPLDPAPTHPVRPENIDYLVWSETSSTIAGRETSGRYFVLGAGVYDGTVRVDCMVALNRPLLIAAMPKKIRRMLTRMLDAAAEAS